jgi:hypothetical protein
VSLLTCPAERPAESWTKAAAAKTLDKTFLQNRDDHKKRRIISRKTTQDRPKRQDFEQH